MVMTTTRDGKETPQYGARIVATFLVLGGLLGLAGSGPALFASVQRQQLFGSISCMLSMGLFAWCVPAGVALWRIRPYGMKWATWLFAIQVPVFSIWRVSYEFSTFFSFRVMIGQTTHHVGANIGSSSTLNLLPQPLGVLFGINLAAVLVVLYLIRLSAVWGAETLDRGVPHGGSS